VARITVLNVGCALLALALAAGLEAYAVSHLPDGELAGVFEQRDGDGSGAARVRSRR
jgi:hypothetical protein